MSLVYRSAAFLMVVSISPGLAQQSQFSGIVAGAVFDRPSSSIRVILGYPGAAHVGSSLFDGVDDAAVAPDSKSAIVLQGSRVSMLVNLDSRNIQTLDLSASTDRLIAAWTSDSQTVVIWIPNSDGTGSFQFWSKQSSEASGPVTTQFPFTGLQSLILLSPQRVVLACLRDGDRSGVYSFDSAGNVQQLIALPDPAAIGLDSTSLDFVYYDRQLGTVSRSSLAGGNPPQTVIATGLDAVQSPCGLAILQDGHIALADTASAALFIFSPDSGSVVKQTQLNTPPDNLLPLGTNEWMVLSHRIQKTDSLLLLNSHTDTVYFVPFDEY